MSLPVSSTTPEEARLRNCIANLAQGISLPFAGRDEILSFPHDGAILDNPTATLAYSIDGKPIAIQLADSILTEQQLADQGVVDFAALPADLRQLLTERAIANDLDQFERWSGLTLNSTTDIATDCVIPFQIGPTRGTILADRGVTEILQSIFEQLPRSEPDLSSQTVNLSIELGRTQVSLSDVSDLQTHDVVLIERGPPILQGQVELRPSSSLLFKAALTETEITIQEVIAMNPEEPEPEAEELETEEPTNEPERLDVGDIPIELVFEIGRQQLTAAEVAEIQPGSTLPLEHSLDDALVSIRANGKLIGNGELVQVGDQVGIRLK